MILAPAMTTTRSDRPAAHSTAADTTSRLVGRAQSGDTDALNDLFSRHVPILNRFARGRLPGWARDLADTHDLVQETVIQAFKNVRGFESRGKGALRAYLRQALLNRLRNEIRRASRRPALEGLDDQAPSLGTSPLQLAIRQQQRERYDAALCRLKDTDRDLIVARLELGLTYEEIAEALGKPSWNAARMGVARALIRLANELKNR
jgi:RNA polymerase sigma-70 factor, ECF subfamily